MTISSGVGVLSSVISSLTSSSNPVCARTWSTVTPACSARSRIRRLDGSKSSSARSVTTAPRLPPVSPARTRLSPPLR